MPAATVSVARSVVVAVVGVALAGAAPADASARTAAIRYSAPPDCPDASTFLSLLAERTARVWGLSVGEGDGGLVVDIRDGAEGKIGSMRRMGRVEQGAREITATDCRDLVQALVLSAALSLGADAAPAREATFAGQNLPKAGGWSWSAGGGVLATFLFPSQPMPEGTLFVEKGRRPWERGFGVGLPDLRLSVSYARNALFGLPRARFALANAALAVCPAGVGLSEAVALRLCLAGEVGVISGEGVAVLKPTTTRFLWAAGGVVLHLRWALTDKLVVEAQAGANAPLERTTFIFEMPRVEVARVSGWVASGGIMAGFTIP